MNNKIDTSGRSGLAVRTYRME